MFVNICSCTHFLTHFFTHSLTHSLSPLQAMVCGSKTKSRFNASCRNNHVGGGYVDDSAPGKAVGHKGEPEHMETEAITESSVDEKWKITYSNAVDKSINPSRAFAHSTHCMACLVESWERYRVVRHISAPGSRYLPALMANVTPLTPSEASALDVEASALARNKTSRCLHKSKATFPATRLEGPLQAWAP